MKSNDVDEPCGDVQVDLLQRLFVANEQVFHNAALMASSNFVWRVPYEYFHW